jgi:hypothetical protein
MLIYLDIVTDRLVIAPGNASPVEGYTTPRGSGPLLRVQPVDAGSNVALPAGFEMAWTVKAAADWGGPTLAYADTFATAPGSTVVTAAVNYETVALDALLHIGSSPELESVDLIAQLAWRPDENATWRPTQLVHLRLHNSVWRGVPGAPAVPDTRFEFLRRWCAPRCWQFSWPADTGNGGNGFYVADVTGTGHTDTSNGGVQVRTGATAGSRARALFADVTLWVGDGSFRTVMWDRPLVFHVAFSLTEVTAAGQCWIKLGNTANTDGDISSEGLQIRIDEDKIWFGAHDGDQLNEEEGPVLVVGTQHDLSIEGQAGEYRFILDGVEWARLAGPTAAIGFDARYAVESYNGADSANQRIDTSPIKIGIIPPLP